MDQRRAGGPFLCFRTVPNRETRLEVFGSIPCDHPREFCFPKTVAEPRRKFPT
jgi:hypothetical protein